MEREYAALRSQAIRPGTIVRQPASETPRCVTLEDPAVEKIGQNLKYDMIVLRGAGVRLAGVAFDTMVASYLLDAGERNHNLDELALRYLGHTTIKISELIGKGKTQKRMDEVPVAAVCDYSAEDAVARLLADGAEADLEARWENLEKHVQSADAQLRDCLERRGQLGARSAALAEDRRPAAKQLELATVERRLADAVRRWQVLAVTCRILESIKETYETERQPAPSQGNCQSKRGSGKFLNWVQSRLR